MAVMRSHLDLVELLCEEGASVNAARKVDLLLVCCCCHLLLLLF